MKPPTENSTRRRYREFHVYDGQTGSISHLAISGQVTHPDSLAERIGDLALIEKRRNESIGSNHFAGKPVLRPGGLDL
jgi:hypothetical protein